MLENQVCRNDHFGTLQHCMYNYYLPTAEENCISKASVCPINQRFGCSMYELVTK